MRAVDPAPARPRRAAVLVGALVAVALLAGCDSARAPAPSPSATASARLSYIFSSGTVEVPGRAAASGSVGGDGCVAAKSDRDVAYGTRAEVRAPGGRVLGRADLDFGRFDAGRGTCTFGFSFGRMPTVRGAYAIHVGSGARAAVRFSESEMSAGPELRFP